MIIKCKECNRDVSDKAMTCPHCGISLRRKRSNSHMRLPNGFGQISKVKGNLRNPYRAMITIGKNEFGKPICKLLKPKAYFKTYNEAYEALMLHQTNPYDQSPIKTILDLYAEWSKEHYKCKKYKNDIYVSSCWPRCEELYNIEIKKLKPMQLKLFIENMDCSNNIKSYTKSLFAMMYDYAVAYEYADKNPARMLNLSYEIETQDEVCPHINYTKDEMDVLWKNINYNRIIPVIIIQCYMGWRPQEICNLTINNVNLEEWYIKGGMKTENGKNRVVPIHPIIRDLVKKYYDNAKQYNSEYLLTDNRGYSLTFTNYRKNYKEIVKEIGLEIEHRPHDGRVTFVTMCKEANVDEYAIKYMVGHSIKDLTERVYTKRTIEWLHKEISKI